MNETAYFLLFGLMFLLWAAALALALSTVPS